jgi:hypothetical protein
MFNELSSFSSGLSIRRRRSPDALPDIIGRAEDHSLLRNWSSYPYPPFGFTGNLAMRGPIARP